LTDNNSVVSINTAGSGGPVGWYVAGQNNLNEQMFWYRVGEGEPQFDKEASGIPTLPNYNKTLSGGLSAVQRGREF
jgi:hypothetical protein